MVSESQHRAAATRVEFAETFFNCVSGTLIKNHFV